MEKKVVPCKEGRENEKWERAEDQRQEERIKRRPAGVPSWSKTYPFEGWLMLAEEEQSRLEETKAKESDAEKSVFNITDLTF